MPYLALTCLALVALLAYREWGARRDRAGAAAELAAVRDQAAEERRELYQRIQAPELAVQEAVRASRPDRPRPRPIAADDDARFAARAKERNGG